MNIFPIKNDNDYQAALAEIDKFMDAELNTSEGDALDIWVTLVESYEAKQFPISAPHSIAENRGNGALAK
jgi:HTH-type transcriptional regulator / antitoxin HigA